MRLSTYKLANNNKELIGLVKKDFWNELDDIVIDLTSN